MLTMDLSELRHHIINTPLTRDSLHDDPIMQFEQWQQQAIDVQFFQPNAMTLATVDNSGQPQARVVLLKETTTNGFRFYTNYASVKAQAIADNDHVALLFYWDKLERQVRIEGMIKQLDTHTNQRYFDTRPRDSQIGAWASPQSKVIPDQQTLLDEVEQVEKRFADTDNIPCPSFWGGYEVTPKRIEFWQGQAGRLHNRFVYSKENHGWLIDQLAP